MIILTLTVRTVAWTVRPQVISKLHVCLQGIFILYFQFWRMYVLNTFLIYYFGVTFQGVKLCGASTTLPSALLTNNHVVFFFYRWVLVLLIFILFFILKILKDAL